MQAQDQRDARPRYTVIPRVLVFLTQGAQVLLLKGAPHKRLWANLWNGVGGHLESGETPYAAALREVHEETGLSVEGLTLRALIHVTLPEPPGIVLFVFVGEAAGVPRASGEGVPQWIARKALLELPLVEDLYTLLPRVLEPGPVFYGAYHFDAAGLQMQWE